MKIRYLKFKNWLLTLAAAAMGIQFGSCAVEYGTPEATYHVKGTVTDPNGQPIPGIQISNYGYPIDTTDAQGNYSYAHQDFPRHPIPITFSDIDSTLNGSYQDTTVSLPTTGIHLSGGDGNWNFGHGLVQFDITLTPKS